MEKEVITTQSIDPKSINKITRLVFGAGGRLGIYFIVILIVFAINIISTLTDPQMRADVTFGEFVPIIAFVVIIGVIFLLRRNATKKQFEKKARYFTNVTYTINNSFFKKQGEGFENTYYWKEIYKIKETPKFYLIFSEKNQAHVIDKAQLDPWQLEEIKEIFNSLKSKVKVSLK